MWPKGHVRKIGSGAEILLCHQGGQAQEIEFGSSPNPVGSGARSLGMGGAFIAVAGDD